MFRGQVPWLRSGALFWAYALHTVSNQVPVIKRHFVKKATMQFTLLAHFVSTLHIIYFPSVLAEFDMDSPLLFHYKDCPGNDALYEEFPEDFAGF
jgi:hypothetical protein